MSYTIITYLGDGSSTGPYPINYPLGILNRADVQCRVGTEVDGFSQPAYRTITWLNDGMVESISGDPPGDGVHVVFTRTVSKTDLIHDYQNGAIITEGNLNDSNKQLLMAIEEILDGRFAAPPSNDSEGLINQTQLTDAINALQAEIDATNASIAGAIAAAVAALDAEIDAKIADALSGLNLKSGDRLLQHLYDSNTVTTKFTPVILRGITPTITSGTQILTKTITPSTIGNTISISVQADVQTDAVYAAMALFIGSTFVSSCTSATQSASYNNIPLKIQYDLTAESLDPIVVSVRLGPSISGYVQLNTGVAGGQIATLVVEEIGTATEGTDSSTPTNPWSINTMVYSGLSFDTSGEESGGIYFTLSTDGTKCYVADNSTNIYEYLLGTAFNISTAVYSGKSVDAYISADAPSYFKISNNGFKLYRVVPVLSRVYSFTMSAAFDISTATLDAGYLSAHTSNTLSGLTISLDGKHLYLINDSTGNIDQYTLGTAFDLSTAVFTQNTVVSGGTLSEADGMTISPDGKTIVISDHITEDILVFTLSTAFDISTVTYSNSLGTLDPPVTASNVVDIVINPAGDKLYALSAIDVIYEYLLT